MELNKIYNENCLETMAQMPDDFIDLTVTSPPYDNLRDYDGYEFDFNSIARELLRVTKNGGVVVWVVSDQTINGSETGTSFKQALYFKEIGFNLHDTMIYFSDGEKPQKPVIRYNQSFEYMFVFSKKSPRKTYIERSSQKTGKIKTKTKRQKDGTTIRGKYEQGGGLVPNIWYYGNGFNRVTTDKIAYRHPAIFPEKLAQDHILSWSDEGDLVYDPFVGSGTTAKIALINNRNFIGSEISEKYCEIANERINMEIIQKKLF